MARHWALRRVLGLAAGLLLGLAHAAPFAYIPRVNGLTVIDLQRDQIVADIPLPGTPVGIGASPGARYVYVSNGIDRVWVVDSVPQAIVAEIPLAQPTAVAVDRNTPRAFVLTGCSPGPCANTLVTTINSNAQDAGGTRSVPGISAQRIELTAGGSRLILTGGNQAMMVATDAIDTHANVTVPGTAGGAAGLPDHRDAMYVSVDQGGTGAIYYYPGAALYAAGAGAVDLAVNPQGTRAYVANSAANTVTVFDITAGAGMATIPVGAAPRMIDVSPTGDRVYVVNSGDNTVTEISAATNTVTRTYSVPIGTTGRGRFIGGLTLFDAPGPLTGLWFNPAQSGWGLHLTQRRTIVFAAWFTYDASGNRKWYVASACRMPPLTCPTCVDNVSCDGDFFEVTGPRFFRDAFNTALVQAVFAGSLRIDFRNRNEATFNYSLGGRSASVPIVRQVFRTGGIAPLVDYTDLWYYPRESGWGLGITQQYGTMFLTWFVYDDAGKPVWYFASDCAVAASGHGCSGRLYRASGPVGPASGLAYDPAALRVTEVGTISVAFTDPSNGFVTYSLDGVATTTKPITRQLF